MVAQTKSVIHLSAVIGEDRKVVIELPADTPVGQVELELVVRRMPTTTNDLPVNTERERIRAKLIAKGILSTAHYLPDDAIVPTEEEMMEAGILPPGARSSEEILREIRDEED
jgi:hypothetical protein